jgi:hypothetical protein
MSEQDIDKLESQFPALSDSAFRAARKEALDAGLSVVESKDGVIYETFPDGTQKVLKKTPPPTRVTAGAIYKIK